MSGQAGPYFAAHAALATGQEARRLRRRFGWQGFGLYVGLACLLLDEGEADVSDDDGWEDLAEALGNTSAGELRALVPYLAERGLADAGRLGDGVLALGISDEGRATYESYRARGKKGAVSRWGKAPDQRKDA